MKLSSKSITAIKLFIDLGEHYEEGFVSLIDIAKRKEVSKKFLEQIVPLYKSNGLIVGTRGNQGGYKLAKHAKEITLKDIIYISESSLQKEKCNYQPVDEVMDNLNKLLDGYFQNISLLTVIDKQKELYENSYVI
mgnify:CR=1 FL=1